MAGSQKEALGNLGFVPEELDLRHYFESPQGLAPALAGRGLIWIIGGNAFLLRRAMRQSGFDIVGRDLVTSGAGRGDRADDRVLEAKHMPYLPLRDREVLLVDGDKAEVV